MPMPMPVPAAASCCSPHLYTPHFYHYDSWPSLHSILEHPSYDSQEHDYPFRSLIKGPHTKPPYSFSVSSAAPSAASTRSPPNYHHHHRYYSSRSRPPRPLLRPMATPRLHTINHQSLGPVPAPDSPPELTDSRSSKSSSLHSTSLSEISGSHDPTHYEDISLESPKMLYENGSAGTGKRDSGKAFVPRVPVTTSSADVPSRTVPQAGTPQSYRDLTSSTKSKKPGLQVQTNGQKEMQSNGSLSIPSRKSTRRGFTSPSTPSLAPSGRQSRSPSPSSRPARSPRNRYTAPPSPSRTNPMDFKPGFMPTVRRQSWQPGRKTVEELEAEYHDSDEDIPDDAVIFNIPMSPRPPHERLSRSPSISSAADSVPETKHHGSAPAALGDNVLSKSPRSSAGSLYSPSVTDSIPEDSALEISRTKSWTAALSDLSMEARELTEKLEEFAGETERERERRIQSGAASARPSIEKSKTAPSVVQLPPVQKGNIMIDPLPISKEKEKVLSRTRPSWLPPKDPQEEKKHLKEYQRMMAHAQETERRMAAKQQEQQQQRDTQHNSISRIWDQHVLPNWEHVIKEPRTRELWWRGVTPRSRGTVWQRAIGNELELSETSYNAALERAKALDKKLSKIGDEKPREALWFESIRRDANEAFPELKIFQHGGPLHDTLIDVLMAYAMYRSDVGYVYGTHLIAGLLILNLSPSAAFITLANILNRPLPMGFLVNDAGAMRRGHDLVLRTMQYKLPNLHQHLTATLKLEPEEYLDPMFRTLFCHCSGLDIVSRIWDVYVFEGDKALIRAAVGVLDALEGRLYGSREEVLALLGWSAKEARDIKDEDAFMTGMRSAGKVDAQANNTTP